METKHNVRHRRQRRIQQLTQMSQKNKGHLYWGDMLPESQQIESGKKIKDDQPAPQRDLPRMDDPEYVWKHGLRYGERTAFDSEANERTYAANGWGSPPFTRKLRTKLLISIVLFAGIWGLFQLEHPLAKKGQLLVRESLTEELNFDAVAAWYEQRFRGAPSFLPSFGNSKKDDDEKVNAGISRSLYVPVLGTVTDPFHAATGGIGVNTQAEAPVAAMDEGRIVFVGERQPSGLTIVIQHADQMQTFYGFLSEALVKENDWVKGGQQIGVTGRTGRGPETTFYFALKKDNQYIDPSGVIRFE